MTDCDQKNGPFLTHDPPLIFDLDMDIEEGRPLDPKSLAYKQIIEIVNTKLKEKNDNIKNGFKSKFNRKKSEGVQPCCNPKKRHCRC